ncbi:MAG: PAS domain S-box protein [Deltaproteobacteria bacterium]|nr:PAS domain S-box protein [Deltaproteobacteria bacterium]
MKGNRAESDRVRKLRQRAESSIECETMDIPDMSPDEVRKLVYELRMHQIELEIQNEELRHAQEELVRSRDRYSDLYDFAPVGYVTIAYEGLILEANLALTQMLGTPRSTLVKRPFSAFIIPDDQEVYYHYRQEILESKQGTCRIRMLGRDAEPFFAQMDSILIEADREKDILIRTIISDITEQKRAEEERLRLETKVLRSQKLESLGVLAGGIAHDFNNLLMGILGNADLAAMNLVPETPAREYVHQIEIASKRAANLAKQMLAYSGKGRFVVLAINLQTLVEEMVHLLEVSISKKVVINYDFAGNVPSIEADATQIRQIVMNLVINASEAIGDHSGVISIRTGVMECDRNYLNDTCLDDNLPEGVYSYFEISDTGGGMDKETIAKIFDPFFTTKFTGRGLGLAAVLGIVRGHKGAVEIRSRSGKGTTFTVLFPALKDSVYSSDIPASVESPASEMLCSRHSSSRTTTSSTNST